MLKLLCKRFYNKKRYANVSFRPHHRFAVPLPRSRRGGFSFTACRLLAPMRGTRTAAKSRRSAKGYGILASPADAGERSTSANHTSFYSCSWDVFPYDLFPVQLCPMGFLLGQVSKWRAQRADRGAHAARGFVCGATLHGGRHALFTASFNAARGYSLSPPPPLRGPPPPLAQGRLFVYGMSASRPDARDADCCKVPSQREGLRYFSFPRRCGGAVNVCQSHFVLLVFLGRFPIRPVSRSAVPYGLASQTGQ